MGALAVLPHSGLRSHGGVPTGAPRARKRRSQQPLARAGDGDKRLSLKHAVHAQRRTRRLADRLNALLVPAPSNTTR